MELKIVQCGKIYYPQRKVGIRWKYYDDEPHASKRHAFSIDGALEIIEQEEGKGLLQNALIIIDKKTSLRYMPKSSAIKIGVSFAILCFIIILLLLKEWGMI